MLQCTCRERVCLSDWDLWRTRHAALQLLMSGMVSCTVRIILRVCTWPCGPLVDALQCTLYPARDTPDPATQASTTNAVMHASHEMQMSFWATRSNIFDVTVFLLAASLI